MSMGEPILVGIVAMAKNRVIGQGGAMPWRLPSDLKRYRRLTMGRPMIMGRKTLESIGRVLDGRDTIVLTRGEGALPAGALRAASLAEAVEIAAARARERGTNEIVIAGGGQVYAAFLDRLDRLELTEIDARPPGDAFFPELDKALWRTVGEEKMERGEKDSADARFLTLERIGVAASEPARELR
ncbi:dihydrofolate reductase [Aureimonas populi]|uniref:Dihydrofolate reductase n=1 Tax=Aureimonas populi TaxID=1701758 RepID=A0ABW5CKM8_9HYPH|nr:dihydrofolate reductase [Aureimonas populi]